ncbi:hypothetical protein Q1695_010023 [Nippostrongylus brasiliensis]|nr:hypothetical protein Q1695_010023 [Nippostrongylus brasiliensis]
MRRKYMALLGLAIFGMVAIGTFTSNIVELDEEPQLQLVTEETPTDSLSILLVGDTGGLPIYPFVTYAQKVVVKAMTTIAAEKKVRYVINVGDNIYFTGVSDEYDSRFKSSFEDVYNTDALDIPWYMIAGNHDHFGNVTAQVVYSKHSKKWHFPDLYYKVTFHLKNATVDVLMLDTIVLCGNTADIENGGFFDMLWNKSHDPEHIKLPGRDNHTIHYIVSGAASRSDRSKKHINTVAKENLIFHYPTSWNPFSQLGFSNGGFALLDINPYNAQITFFNGKGNEKHRAQIARRTSKSF